MSRGWHDGPSWRGPAKEKWNDFRDSGYLQGVLLILAGLLILFVPEILVALVASAFVGGGILRILIAREMRRLRRDTVRGSYFTFEDWI